MKFPDPTVHWAWARLKPLLRRRGAPDSIAAQESYAASVLRIAHPGLVRLRQVYQDRDVPTSEIEKATAMLPVELSAIAEPMDWLVMQADDEARYFMEPVDLREIFIERYPCADGRKKFAARGKEAKK